MSERDSVHTEIEKLQEKVEARQARISQLEKKTKEHEGEVITFSFSHFNRARHGRKRRGERRKAAKWEGELVFPHRTERVALHISFRYQFPPTLLFAQYECLTNITTHSAKGCSFKWRS